MHKFEFTHSEVLDDYTHEDDEALRLHKIFDSWEWRRAQTPLWEKTLLLIVLCSMPYLVIGGTLYVIEGQHYWLGLFEFLYIYAVGKWIRTW